MATIPIVLYPHDALTTAAEPVTEFDAELGKLLDDMAETMYAAPGIGLAANQVDILKRVTVIDISTPETPSKLYELVNPEVIARSGKVTWEEGCLSFPRLFGDVERAERVTVRYQDRHGETHEVEADGLLSVCMQHEIDHLDGIVFTDRMPPLRRRMTLKRYRKLCEEAEAGDG